MKITKFITIGLVITMLAYGLYIFLIQIGFHYQVALALDYIFGISMGYVLNRYWTFASHAKPRLSFTKYCVTYIAVYLGNMVLLGVFVEFFMLGTRVGQLISLSTVTLLSYFAQNNWVFKA